jgi:hypothetical protein
MGKLELARATAELNKAMTLFQQMPSTKAWNRLQEAMSKYQKLYKE